MHPIISAWYAWVTNYEYDHDYVADLMASCSIPKFLVGFYQTAHNVSFEIEVWDNTFKEVGYYVVWNV